MNFSSTSSSSGPVYKVPSNGVDLDDMVRIAAQTFDAYSSNTVKKNGKGSAIVWFRNDLRILDIQALFKAWISSLSLLPVYSVDPRLFQTTYHFGFPKTGECLADLKKNLMKRGPNLLIQRGLPEEILPTLAEASAAHTVYAQKETCSEELHVERLVSKALQRVKLSPFPDKSDGQGSTNSPKLQLVWGGTMYHMDDLPFSINNIPDEYTQFCKSVEAKSAIRSCVKFPTSLAPLPIVEDWGCVPTIDQLGLGSQKVDKGMRFLGGETAALSRVHEYSWKKVKRNEKERQANDSAYWDLFELIWRDYFRFLSVKYGNSLFHLGGPRKVEHRWSQDQRLFESWRDGRTGYPLIDANMKELSTTGFMSNGGRQTWALTGVWGLNGLRHASWIMTSVPIMGTGPMEQDSEMTLGKVVISASQSKQKPMIQKASMWHTGCQSCKSFRKIRGTSLEYHTFRILYPSSLGTLRSINLKTGKPIMQQHILKNSSDRIQYRFLFPIQHN